MGFIPNVKGDRDIKQTPAHERNARRNEKTMKNGGEAHQVKNTGILTIMIYHPGFSVTHRVITQFIYTEAIYR
jgi:hypothetical protein